MNTLERHQTLSPPHYVVYIWFGRSSLQKDKRVFSARILLLSTPTFGCTLFPVVPHPRNKRQHPFLSFVTSVFNRSKKILHQRQIQETHLVQNSSLVHPVLVCLDCPPSKISLHAKRMKKKYSAPGIQKQNISTTHPTSKAHS